MRRDVDPQKKEQMIDSFLNRLRAELMATDVYYITMENHIKPIQLGPFSPLVWPTLDKHPLTFTFFLNHNPYQRSQELSHPNCRCCMPDILK